MTTPVRLTLMRFSLLVAAWTGLTLLHYFLVYGFAGWLGVADDFLPWSIVAWLLWRPTRRSLEPWPRWGRTGVHLLWLAAVTAALLGIDEHLWTPDWVFWVYLSAPLVIAVVILCRLSVAWSRNLRFHPD